jgi:hypothetical protein
MIFNMYAALYLFLHNDTRIINSNGTQRNIEWNLFFNIKLHSRSFWRFHKGILTYLFKRCIFAHTQDFRSRDPLVVFADINSFVFGDVC